MANKYRWIALFFIPLVLLAACVGQATDANTNESQSISDPIPSPETVRDESKEPAGQAIAKNTINPPLEAIETIPSPEKLADVNTTVDAETNAAEDDPEEQEIIRPVGWSEESHGDDADPNYDVVFPEDVVNRIDIVIEADRWQAMLDDMTLNYGEFGTGENRGGRMGAGEGGMPQGGNMPPVGRAAPQEGVQPPADGAAPQGGIQPPGGGAAPQEGIQPPAGGPPEGGGQRNMDQGLNIGGSDENPIWAEATIEFNRETWTNVGIRFKGNSSLSTSWKQGVYKLPFKLDFDEYEDEYPEIDDQRFYGFKQLALSNNTRDTSFLRESIAADLYRKAGVPAPETAFYEVYLDYGEGSIYFGLYTMVEVVDDTVIETQFTDAGGNLYKPEGSGATFAANTFDEAAFDKETNEDEADFSDVKALYEVLNSEQRTTDPAAWREKLESIFNVDVFIQWLAANTVIQNWDVYGNAAHNFYLYNDPTTGQLTWIVWDMNESLKSDSGMRSVSSLSQDEVSEQWPLIRYLLDDEVYYAQYVAAIEDFATNVLNPETLSAKCQELAEIIRPSETSEAEGYTFLTSADEFDTSLDQLVQHIEDRYQAALDFVATQ
ncbi:MAG: CotH kinase family protein [Anaerolineales bacterium]|nr:CotH kinase family protein [Anaerolineales bacterium]